ncbi:MAG: FAD-dependent thymidylate synthase [Candidatus Omnitrophica bacterium]|jgi:thymidylate synthase (FAD)|nr:FAD-dependent thymidylate synthase [Candidatus Omnitrophota bacterium]
MKGVKAAVKLLAVTPDALSVIYSAARQCYSKKYAADIYNDKSISSPQKRDFIKRIVSSGHESPLEHVTLTFSIKGVSRALSHQLVRHRLASYSQQSQRYVPGRDFNFIMPASIEKTAVAKKIFIRSMKNAQRDYGKIIKLLQGRVEKGKASEDARFVLPQAAETMIVFSMNCRQLLHFFSQRCCARAQWEIRALANAMLAICRKNIPEIFAKAGAVCERLGYCPEGKNYTCGRYPVSLK